MAPAWSSDCVKAITNTSQQGCLLQLRNRLAYSLTKQSVILEADGSSSQTTEAPSSLTLDILTCGIPSWLVFCHC